MVSTFTALKNIMCSAGVLHDPNHSKVAMISANCYFLGVFIFYFISTLWFFCFHAKKLAEYTGCFYFNCCSSLVFTWYSSFVWYRKDFADLFKTLDEMIEKSKLNNIDHYKPVPSAQCELHSHSFTYDLKSFSE